MIRYSSLTRFGVPSKGSSGEFGARLKAYMVGSVPRPSPFSLGAGSGPFACSGAAGTVTRGSGAAGTSPSARSRSPEASLPALFSASNILLIRDLPLCLELPPVHHQVRPCCERHHQRQRNRENHQPHAFP